MSFLKFIKWSDLENWSANYYFQEKTKKSDFQYVLLNSVIKEENNKIKPFESPEQKFGILGVNNKTGIFDNEIMLGKNIKQPYKIVKNNFIAYNPYRVNVGSIGIKTEEQKFDLISSAYVVISCDYNKILPKFLFLLFKTDNFNKTIRDNTKGSVRQTLSFDILKSLQIPLPPIDIQEKIVDEYQKRILEIENLKKQNEIIEQNSKNYLLQELGIDNLNSQSEFNKTNKILHFKKYSEIKDWSVESSLLKTLNMSKQYPIVSIKEMAEINPRTDFQNLNYCSFLPMEAISTDGFILKNEKQNTKDSKGFTKFKENDIIWAKITPCMQNKKSVICKNLINGFGIGSTEFYVFRVKQNTNLKFLYHFLRNDYFIDIAKKHFKGSAGQQRVPKSFLENFQIPLPPLNIQKQIVEYLDDLQMQIDKNKTEISNLEIIAKKEFEMAVFG